MSHYINAAAVLPRNAEKLRWVVHKALQVVYQARVRRLVSSLRRRLVAVTNARVGPTCIERLDNDVGPVIS